MVTMRSRLIALVLFGTYLSLACGGCLSSEYVVPKDELSRLVSLPPSQRGANVRAVQALGTRDEDAVDNVDAVPEVAYADEFAIYDQPEEIAQAENLDIQMLLEGGPVEPPWGRPFPRTSRWRQPLPRSGPRDISSHSSGGGNLNLGNLGGGGGGNAGDELAIVAIIVVAVAIMAAAGLAVTEGIRYDGFVQLHPAQPVHLKNDGGEVRAVPLDQLTPADVAGSSEAAIKDDEAWGFRFAGRRPLDRKGMAFKVELGSLDSLCACYSAAGLASNIQLGYFPHQRVGLLGTLTLGGGTSALEHTFQRHSVNLEAQAFPLNLWRLHLGAFGHVGYQLASDELGTRDGQAWGGGAILEIALSTRLALSGRWDYTTARTAPENGAWASTSIITAGLAIY